MRRRRLRLDPTSLTIPAALPLTSLSEIYSVGYAGLGAVSEPGIAKRNRTICYIHHADDVLIADETFSAVYGWQYGATVSITVFMEECE